MSATSFTGAREPATHAFPKQFRLTKTDEFSSVFGFRRALRSPHFLLHYRLRTNRELPFVSGPRLGLVVAKKLLKRSVDRNLVKRLARESFRLLRCRLSACDLILRLAARPKPLDRRVVADEIRGLLGKLARSET